MHITYMETNSRDQHLKAVVEQEAMKVIQPKIRLELAQAASVALVFGERAWPVGPEKGLPACDEVVGMARVLSTVQDSNESGQENHLISAGWRMFGTTQRARFVAGTGKYLKKHNNSPEWGVMVSQVGHVSNFFLLSSIESRKLVERYRAAFKNAA